MIQKLEIEGYRCFEKLTVEGLASLNLIVGKNNSGKSSMLECIQLLSSSKPKADLHSILERRGELATDSSTSPVLFQPESLFFTRSARIGSRIALSNDCGNRFSVSIKANNQNIDVPGLNRPGSMLIESSNGAADTFDIDENGYAEIGSKQRSFFAQIGGPNPRTLPRPFIPNTSFPLDQIRALWEELKLQGREDEVLAILRELDSDIEYIDFFNTVGNTNGHVKLKSLGKYVPLGTLGDGTSRLFALAVAAATHSDDVLLVDEIDTGFHYSTLSQVWQMLYKFSLASETQIFATTHSQDCVEAFANLVRDDIAHSADLSLQRVVKGKSHAVTYSGDALLGAVKFDYEVR